MNPLLRDSIVTGTAYRDCPAGVGDDLSEVSIASTTQINTQSEQQQIQETVYGVDVDVYGWAAGFLAVALEWLPEAEARRGRRHAVSYSSGKHWLGYWDTHCNFDKGNVLEFIL